MKRITIELSPDSCKAALKELKAYQKSLKSKYNEICKRLAQIGAQEAQVWFNKGAAEGNGGTVVSIRPIENGWAITASGEDVYFVEFGTGKDVQWDTHGFRTSVPIYPGSWSEEHAEQYSTYGYWYYRKVKYEGTPAYMPMYHAEQKIRENERRIAEEVLGR